MDGEALSLRKELARAMARASDLELARQEMEGSAGPDMKALAGALEDSIQEQGRLLLDFAEAEMETLAALAQTKNYDEFLEKATREAHEGEWAISDGLSFRKWLRMETRERFAPRRERAAVVGDDMLGGLKAAQEELQARSRDPLDEPIKDCASTLRLWCLTAERAAASDGHLLEDLRRGVQASRETLATLHGVSLD